MAGCSSLPEDTFRTDEGCHSSIWNEKWAKENIRQVSWSGACTDGLIEGAGTLRITRADGGKLTYTGKLRRGDMTLQEGEFVDANGWRHVGSFWHLFQLRRGEVYRPDGKLVFKGSIVAARAVTESGATRTSYRETPFNVGVLYLNDGAGTRVEGEFAGSVGVTKGLGGVDVETGRGIVRGIVLRGSERVAYFVEGRRLANLDEYEVAVQRLLDRRASVASDSGPSERGGAAPEAQGLQAGPSAQAVRPPTSGADPLAPPRVFAIDGPGTRTSGCLREQVVPWTPGVELRFRKELFTHLNPGEAIVVTNTCSERLFFVTAACHDVYATRPGSWANLGSWAGGDHTGMAPVLARYWLRPGEGFIVAWRGLDRVPDRHAPREYLYGAWEEAFFNANGAVFVRAERALRHRLNLLVRGPASPPDSTVGSVVYPNPAVMRSSRPDRPTCATAQLKSTWEENAK